MALPSGSQPGVDDETFVAAVKPYADALTRLADSAYALRTRHNFTPAADSIAMADLAAQAGLSGAWDAQPIETANSQISLWLSAGEDAMVTFAQAIVAERTPLFTYATIGRAGLENLALARWVSQPDVSAKERVRRSLNERLYSEYQRARLPPEVRGTNHSGRLLKAAALGFNVTKGGGRKEYYLDPARPSISTSVRRVLGDDALGATLYSYLSAIAHGAQWGLSQRMDRDLARETLTGMEAPLMISAHDIGMVAVGLIIAHTRTFSWVIERTGWKDTSDYDGARTHGWRVFEALMDASGEERPQQPGPASPMMLPPTGLWLPRSAG